jgi:hypothetical protein
LDINQCSLPLTSWFCFAVGLTWWSLASHFLFVFVFSL